MQFKKCCDDINNIRVILKNQQVYHNLLLKTNCTMTNCFYYMMMKTLITVFFRQMKGYFILHRQIRDLQWEFPNEPRLLFNYILSMLKSIRLFNNILFVTKQKNYKIIFHTQKIITKRRKKSYIIFCY